MQKVYIMSGALRDFIMDQRREAEEFSKKPGCYMGMMPHPDKTEYWSERVPTGTLQEYKRIELEESAYYMAADAMSKSYARSLDLASMSDADLHELCEDMANLMEADAQEEQMREETEQNHFDSLAGYLEGDLDKQKRRMEDG